MAKATLELAGACLRADNSVRKRIELELGVSNNEEAIDSLDKQLSESKVSHCLLFHLFFCPVTSSLPPASSPRGH